MEELEHHQEGNEHEEQISSNVDPLEHHQEDAGAPELDNVDTLDHKIENDEPELEDAHDAEYTYPADEGAAHEETTEIGANEPHNDDGEGSAAPAFEDLLPDVLQEEVKADPTTPRPAEAHITPSNAGMLLFPS